MPRLLALFAAALLLTIGCGRDQETASTVEPAAAKIFNRIDADTPYLMANLQRLPDELVDLYWNMNASFIDTDGPVPGAADREDLPAPIQAVLAEFEALSSREAFEKLGLRGDGLWAVHGVSVYPVVHWELRDPDAFADTLERIAARADAVLPERTLEEVSYLWLPFGGAFGLAIHHDAGLATVALLPDDPDLKRRAFGIDAAAAAYDPATLAQLNQDYGYTPYGSGFVDWSRMIGLLLDPEHGPTAPLRAAIEHERFAADPACRREYAALTRALPRLISGYSRVDAAGAEFHLRQEISARWAAELAKTAETPAGLDMDAEAALGIGSSLNLVALRDFLRELVSGWVDNPPACAAFARIAEQAPEWQLALNRPIPPVVTNIHGIRIAVDSLALDRDGQPGAEGTIAVFMHNPQLLLGMAQMFSPALAELDLAPGGPPQALPPGLMPQLEGTQAFIALGSGALGLAVGAEHKDRLPAAMQALPVDGTILMYTVDFRVLGQWMESMAEKAEVDEDIRLTGGDVFERLGRIYERVGTRVRLDGRGVEVVTAVEFAQD